MQHAIFRGQGHIDIAAGPEPSAGPGEVLLRVLACALCGSDLRPLRNGWPVTPGHEVVGRVDQPGHALHGQRCLVYIPVWCGRCPSCLGGDTHLCDHATELVGWQRHGGYADALLVPTQCLLPVPDDVPTHLAPLLLDTIGTAAHGVRLSQALVPAGRVLVLGAGPIGLGALLVLQHFGYGPIDVLDPNDFRRGVAAELGGRPVTLPDAQRYPLVLECSGKDAARQTALEVVAARGVVVQLGEADAWQVTETKAIRRKDFYYVRSFYFPVAEYALNIELLRADRARYERLVDARVPLDGLQDLFAQFARGERLKPQLSLVTEDGPA
jgi:threonine dehydrogenase-like Zn-dependent dehydrogenase